MNPVNTAAAEFEQTRGRSLADCKPLQVEDYGLQAAAFASPPKWHLAHTTWFFETFILKPFSDHKPVEPLYEVLFNSYYNGIGEQHPRARRGLLSRPTVQEVLDYRRRVDQSVGELLEHLLQQEDHPDRALVLERLELGIEHERQHQELFFTDLKYSLGVNPLYPVYREREIPEATGAVPLRWLDYPGGLTEIGNGGEAFGFDNESPRHTVFLHPFQLASRLVTNGEYQDFVDDGGYSRPELWLSDGWDTVQAEGWTAPLHWVDRDGQTLEFTLHGLQNRWPANPVCHLSGYEADAYARWAGARLPTEQEWEHAATSEPGAPVPANGGACHPGAAAGGEGLDQLYGACWQWTQSAYGPYPGFAAAEGAIGEYNGKFMSNQWVLRGGSCVTASSQSRPAYRNFFYPRDRWQFSGLRLARTPGAAPALESPALESIALEGTAQ